MKEIPPDVYRLNAKFSWSAKRTGRYPLSRTAARIGLADMSGAILNTGSSLTCPYHQWTYDFDGKLLGMPYRRGIKGKGGMPDDFDMSAHGLIA